MTDDKKTDAPVAEETKEQTPAPAKPKAEEKKADAPAPAKEAKPEETKVEE